MSGERTAVRGWDAPAYHRVSNPQVAWGISVLQRLPLSGDETVIDAGCGTGRLTSRLLERVPRGTVICVDRSSAMLNLARDHLAAESSRVRCVLADLADLPLIAAADAIFSTATFHWVPDHPRLFACLHAALRPGGRLVAQCGGSGNLDQLHSRASAFSVLDEMTARAAQDAPPFRLDYRRLNMNARRSR